MNRLDLYRLTGSVLSDQYSLQETTQFLKDFFSEQVVHSLERVSVYELTLYELVLGRKFSDDESLRTISLVKTAFRYKELVEMLFKKYECKHTPIGTLATVRFYDKSNSDFIDNMCSSFMSTCKELKRLSTLPVDDFTNALVNNEVDLPNLYGHYFTVLISGYMHAIRSNPKLYSLSSFRGILQDDEFLFSSCFFVIDSVYKVLIRGEVDLDSKCISYNMLGASTVCNFLEACCVNMPILANANVSVELSKSVIVEQTLRAKLDAIKKLAKSSSKYEPKPKGDVVINEPQMPFEALKPAEIETPTLSKADMIKASENANILILASDRVKFKSSKVRVENALTVSDEVLRGQYDAIFLITKFIGHKHSYRIKSLATSPVHLTSITNYKLLMQEIYDKVVLQNGVN
jgi:hypothetical protein